MQYDAVFYKNQFQSFDFNVVTDLNQKDIIEIYVKTLGENIQEHKSNIFKNFGNSCSVLN